jgi:general secretion pathway protein D
MVLSGMPDQPLQTAAGAATPCVLRHLAGPERKLFTMKMMLRASVALVLLCGMIGAATQAHAQSAGAWDKRGASAEARDDFDAAFEAYRQAHLKSPKDMRYKTHYERMRFQSANQHVDRGRRCRRRNH